MSRHEIPAKQEGLAVTVGWDNPMMSFFAQVERTKADLDTPESLVLLLGATPREHTRPETMADALRPYADLSPDILKTLVSDRVTDLERGPTPLQRTGAGLFAQPETGRGLPNDQQTGTQQPNADSGPTVLQRSGLTEGGSSPSGTVPNSASFAGETPASASAGSSTGNRQAMGPENDQIKDILDQMKAVSDKLGPEAQALKDTVNRLASQVLDPARVSQQSFRTGVAYAMHDLQNFAGATFQLGGDFAQEMSSRYTSSPGLTNPRMLELMQETPNMSDRTALRQVRQVAASIAKRGADQDGADSQAEIAQLENRLRLSQAPNVEGNPRPMTAASSPQPNGAADSDSQAASSATVPRTQQAAQTVPGIQMPPTNRSVIRDIVRRARMPIPTGARIRTTPPPSPIGQRIALFEERLAQGKTDRLMDSADRSGARAMEAAEQFITGSGRGILGKIEAAASTEPGGMQTVMKEMQPGGRYANLRTEFDNAYQQDRTFAGAYDKLVESTNQFGRDRSALQSNFALRGLDPTTLDGRFQRTEEALGEAASMVPGKTPGKSMVEELGEKLAEVLKGAVEKVKSLFGHEAAAENNPRPSVSMSM